MSFSQPPSKPSDDNDDSKKHEADVTAMRACFNGLAGYRCPSEVNERQNG